MDKKLLSMEEIDAQTALELPDRETLLITIVITDVLNNLTLNLNVQACVICSDVQFGNVTFPAPAS